MKPPSKTQSSAPRHFVQIPLAIGQSVQLPADTSHHIGRVTRMRSGDAITLFNGDGFFYSGSLRFEGKTDCIVTVENALQAEAESKIDITLLQGLASSEKMAWAIEKATELGVNRIIPIECHRSVAQISADKAEKKQIHWLNIARAASAQCGRAKIPLISPPVSSTANLQFQEIRSNHDALLVLSPLASESLSTWAKAQNAQNAQSRFRIAIYIGPEGGLDDAELSFAIQQGFKAILLGPRVLRTEIAGATTIAALQALIGDF
jgi:16S rRNA (uracil1498-N3)-methyltransferase